MFVASFGLAQSEENVWPQFRGPDGQGNVNTADVPLNWSETENVLWKTPLPGLGWSSPVVWGDQIWMTSAVTVGDPVPGDKGTASYKVVRFFALCVDRKSGKLVHNIPLFEVEHPEHVHALNGYASPSPCIEAGRVYCHFGRNGTACIDTNSGSVLWRREFVIDHYVGAGSSPVLVDDLLILTCDGADRQFIVAVHKSTGLNAWRVDRPEIDNKSPDRQKSFATPLLVNYEGQNQLIIPGAQWIVSYDPKSGNEIWREDHGTGFSLVCRPVSDGEMVYFCTGFASNKLMALFLDPSDKLENPRVLWEHDRQVPNQPSPVLHGGHIILISDAGVAQSIDADTGDVNWKKRIGGNFSASVLRVGDRYYFFSREGVTTAIDSKGKKLAKNTLDGSLMATPAVVDNQWIIRTDTHLYAIGNQ